MTKSLILTPEELRKQGKITFEDIPVNAYQKTVKDELDNFSKEDLKRILRDMLVIREFETVINSIKVTEEYEGIKYSYPGPAHLGIGQEAAQVGMAYNLNVEDLIFGTHRSHGDFIAKSLRTIEELSDEELTEIMRSTFDGETYDVVMKHTTYTDVKDIAREFLLYGFMAETFGRRTGFSKGLGGSMHAYFLPFGVFPNNAIVGGSGPIATGAALYKRVNNKKGIVVANLGDASMGCGPVYESMNFSAMDQFNTLWDEVHKGGLPIIYSFMNNAYGMGGQTKGETMAYDMLARIGAGISPSQMHAERVDGYNPLAVIDAFRRKKELVANRKGPALLDIVTYRYSGHSPSDSGSYRTKEELAMWEEADAIKAYEKQLVEAGVMTEAEIADMRAGVKKDLKHVTALAVDLEISPRLDFVANPNVLSDIMFSNETRMSLDETREPEVLIPKEENPRVQKIARKVRSAYDEKGNKVSKNKTYQFRDGVFEAVLDKFYTDPTLVAYGEENRDWGGAFACYNGLTESLPYHRLFNAPISEAAIVGTAVGYCMAGGRALVELMYADFMGRAGDEIFNQMSKWQAMSAGVLKMPLVLRMSVGSKYGAQHSQDWSALCTHIPGLKVVFPATPYDAKGMLNAALSGTDPVIFLESQRIYDVGEMFQKEVPEGYYEVPLGEPDVKIKGDDVTILSVGATLYRVLDAVKILKEQYGMSAEVIDARSMVPFNYEPVIESVKKTGRIVITGDACARTSMLKEFAQTITELAFDYLDAPPVVVGSKNWITPAHELEDYFFPQASWIVDAIHEKIVPLPGHVCTANFTKGEQVRANKKGV